MVRITWSGWGLLTALLLVPGMCVPIFINNGKITVSLLLIDAAVVLACGLINHLLAVALNSAPGPGGRQWTNRHTLEQMPMQLWYRVFLGFAGILLAAAAAAAAGSALLWFLIMGVFIVLAFIPGMRRQRVREKIAGQRKVLTARGWQLGTGEWPKAGERIFPFPAYRGKGAFGFVTGEANGVRFTVCDFLVRSDSWLRTQRQTVWVAHLPFKAAMILITWSSADRAVRVAPDEYAQALNRSGFLQAMIAAGLPVLIIDEWGLRLTGLGAGPDEVAARVDTLTAIAKPLEGARAELARPS